MKDERDKLKDLFEFIYEEGKNRAEASKNKNIIINIILFIYYSYNKK